MSLIFVSLSSGKASTETVGSVCLNKEEWKGAGGGGQAVSELCLMSTEKRKGCTLRDGRGIQRGSEKVQPKGKRAAGGCGKAQVEEHAI